MNCKSFLIVFIGLFSIQFSDIYSHAWVVDQKHIKASDDQKTGSYEWPFRTISRAAELAGPGDTVLVFSGIYRERVAPARGGLPGAPVVYMASPGERVIIKGSEVWENTWKPFGDYENIYESKLSLEAFGSYNPFYTSLARIPGRQSLGQIFIEGERMVQVDSLTDLVGFPGSWMLSYDSLSVLIHYPGKYTNIPVGEALIEYSVRDKIFAPHKRGLGYITVEGFIMEHCANQFPSGFYNPRGRGHPQAGALSCRAGHHWVIRNNTIRLAKNLAIDCGYEGRWDIEGDQPTPPGDSIGYHLIEYNKLLDNGCGGIAGATQHQSIIRYNWIERNNYLGHTAPETGGIKVHFFYDGIIEGNIIRDNECLGIWLDNQWYNSRVTQNVVLNNRGQGIFVELGDGPCLVDNNIVAYNEDGIYLHDASGVTIVHNLMYVNAHFGFYARIVSERGIRQYPSGERERAGTKNLTIKNNIFIDNYRGHVCLPLDDGERVTNNISDYNLFINGTQWQWEGLGFNSFTAGSNDKRVPGEQMAVSLEKALRESNYPDSLIPNLTLWKDQPLLTYQMWVELTGNDRNSFLPGIHTGEVENGAIAKGAMNLSTSNLYFDLKNSETFTRFRCPKIGNLNNDFFGNKMNGDEVLPGPFQNYIRGENRFYLSPVME
jgi:parallel beta-helix repeat protein